MRVAGHDRVTDVQRALLHQHGGHRTTAAVEVCLDRDALRRPVDGSPQVQRRVGGQDYRLQQPVDVDPALRGDVDEHRVAAVVLRDQPVLGELLAHLARVGVRLVDLVDRHHDRHVGRLGVVQRLDRLRHHAVVCRDDQYHDVRGLGAAGPHGGERLVARGVDKHHRVPVGRIDSVCADALRDAAGLACRDSRLADGVQD